MRQKLPWILIFCLILSIGSSPSRERNAQAGNQTIWPSITASIVVGGLEAPVHITNAGDGSGRLFVVEQAGRIRIIHSGAIQSTFLDITDRVRSPYNGGGTEEGLLSVAFPAGFPSSRPYFYIYYTLPVGNNQVSRFYLSSNLNLADPDSEEKILELAHPTYSNHNGGQLAFGPDGYLYIGTGDGGGGGHPNGNAQNTDSLLGKLLRIDVEFTKTVQRSGSFINYLPIITRNSSEPPDSQAYRIPADNPFVGVAGYREEIWAVGLRNPWRFSFNRMTGDLYIGDVGQNTWEEIDFQPFTSSGGENYGWNIMEGLECYNSSTCSSSGLTLPTFTYQTDVEGCSVSGGYVYRGSNIPGLLGIYLLGDYCSGKIWGLQKNGTTWENTELLDSPYWISSFGEDESGGIYFADRASGTIYQIIEFTAGQ